ncbi:MAG: YcxB family protein [Eubacterium sp.]|nr:YcxB family protein [Eubacterium sp.]
MSPIEFQVRMDAKSLSGFVIYHNYVRPGGILGLFLSVAAIVALIVRWGHWTGMQRALLVALALLFLIFQPLMLLQKANAQLHSKAFASPMDYSFGETEFTITQDGKSETFSYSDIRKTVFRKKVCYLYMSTVSAFIIPSGAVTERYAELKELIKRGRSGR